MKKVKILAALAATMAVGATCAFAANPFADVPADSWAYQSVVTLANSGILQGVDGTHFQGNRNITRYEAAEITAKAMAHADRANAQQRAVINKLVHEFAGELNNLGVRVANLEDQVGTVKFSGGFKGTYIHHGANTTELDINNYGKAADAPKESEKWMSAQDIYAKKDTLTDPKYADSVRRATDNVEKKRDKNTAVQGDASYSYEAKLQATAKVSDKIQAAFGFKYTDEFKNSEQAEASHAYVNVANVQAAVTDRVSVLAGRHELTLGQGYIYDDVAEGAAVQYAGKTTDFSAGYAKLKKAKNYKLAYVQAKATVCDRAAVGAYYGHVVVPGASKEISTQVYGASLQAKVSDKVQALVSYEKYHVYDTKNKQTTDSAAVRYGKVMYGNADFATPKSWDIWVDYLNTDKFSIPVSGDWRIYNLKNNASTSWGIGVDYVFAKNAKLEIKQTLASKKKTEPVQGAKVKFAETTKAQLVFVF